MPAQAFQVPDLSDAEVESLVRDGDRLADQYRYEDALKNYTKAYTDVVSDIRGQQFTRPVKPMMFDREELGQEMKRLLEKELTEEDLAELNGALKVFGFVAAEDDPAEIYTQLLTEQVAGFYDPDDKRMVLIVEDPPEKAPGWLEKLLGGEPFNKDEQKTTLAHELTHALQDQLYDLNGMEDRIVDDDDLSYAFSALVEGDATLLMFCEMQDTDVRDMDPNAMRATFNLMSWLMPIAGGESIRKAPAIFRDTLTFPYFQGLLCVLAVASEEGWPGVHRMYSRPPASTEQILHPSKYLRGDDYDPPQAIQLPDSLELLGAGWKSLGRNCLGELQTSILLKKTKLGRVASEGWDGDAYEVFAHDDELGLVMGSVWDSEEDAAEFFDALCEYLDVGGPKVALRSNRRRTKEPASPETKRAPTLQYTAPCTEKVFGKDASHVVRLSADRVWLASGFDAPLANRLIDKASLKAKFSEKEFPQ